MKIKLFGTQTGLPASELVLGAASFGTRRGYGADKEEIPKILSAYTDAGGNFFDIADQYQFGQAEEIVGEFIGSMRHNFIVCSKYTRSSEANPSAANFGNHRKAMRGAVEASLKRLKTDYIDIYMPHFDDGVTPPEEIARGLEDLLKDGKIVYAGLTNFPAWKAAAIGKCVPLSAIQMEYNLVQRTAERELLPMAKYFGLSVMFYSPLAGGLLTGKYRNGETGRLKLNESDNYQENAKTMAVLDTLEAVAKETSASAGQVALAWTLTKKAFPIVGARTLAHLQDGLKALDIILSVEQIARLDDVSGVSMGYPHDILKTVQRSY